MNNTPADPLKKLTELSEELGLQSVPAAGLPPLPEPAVPSGSYAGPVGEGASENLYAADQMHAYALAAIACQGDAVEFCWCIESENSADWCFAADREGVLSNAKFLDPSCIPSEPFKLYRFPPAITAKDAKP
jgi:hypothetical protein